MSNDQLNLDELEELGTAVGLTHDDNDPKVLTLRLHKAEIALAGMALHYYLNALRAGTVGSVDGPDDADKQELVGKYTMLRLGAYLEQADDTAPTLN